MNGASDNIGCRLMPVQRRTCRSTLMTGASTARRPDHVTLHAWRTVQVRQYTVMRRCLPGCEAMQCGHTSASFTIGAPQFTGYRWSCILHDQHRLGKRSGVPVEVQLGRAANKHSAFIVHLSRAGESLGDHRRLEWDSPVGTDQCNSPSAAKHRAAVGRARAGVNWIPMQVPGRQVRFAFWIICDVKRNAVDLLIFADNEKCQIHFRVEVQICVKMSLMYGITMFYNCDVLIEHDPICCYRVANVYYNV